LHILRGHLLHEHLLLHKQLLLHQHTCVIRGFSASRIALIVNPGAARTALKVGAVHAL
jgi:hypothetical protein